MSQKFRCKNKSCGKELTEDQFRDGGGLCADCLREGLRKIAEQIGKKIGHRRRNGHE